MDDSKNIETRESEDQSVINRNTSISERSKNKLDRNSSISAASALETAKKGSKIGLKRTIASETASHGTEIVNHLHGHTYSKIGLNIISIILHPLVMVSETISSYHRQKTKNNEEIIDSLNDMMDKNTDKIESLRNKLSNPQLHNNAIEEYQKDLDELKILLAQKNEHSEIKANINSSIILSGTTAATSIGLTIAILTGSISAVTFGAVSIGALSIASLARSAVGFIGATAATAYYFLITKDNEKAHEQINEAIENLSAFVLTVGVIALITLTPPGQSVAAGMFMAASACCITYIGYDLFGSIKAARQSSEELQDTLTEIQDTISELENELNIVKSVIEVNPQYVNTAILHEAAPNDYTEVTIQDITDHNDQKVNETTERKYSVKADAKLSEASNNDGSDEDTEESGNKM